MIIVIVVAIVSHVAVFGVFTTMYCLEGNKTPRKTSPVMLRPPLHDCIQMSRFIIQILIQGARAAVLTKVVPVLPRPMYVHISSVESQKKWIFLATARRISSGKIWMRSNFVRIQCQYIA
jgi:hypothetical protein